MPTTQRKAADVEAPADSPTVADTPAPVEASEAAPATTTSQPEEQQPMHPDELWQHDERVPLIFIGESGTVVFPMAALGNGAIRYVPRTLAESYLRTRLFTTPVTA